MTIGLVTYPGVVFAKGATYTQTRGVEPDSIALRLIPQTSAIATVGDIVLTFGGTDTITLPDCLADKSNVWLNENGFTGTVVFQDRRWRWSRAKSYSWHVNDPDDYSSHSISLRAFLQELFAWIGEPDADVSRVTDAFEPEHDLVCVDADEVIANLCSQYGYKVCLGFGNDPVEVWPLGTGRSIDTTVREVMRISTSVDPATNPRYSEVCFGPTVFQARFRMVAVGLDTDGSVKEIDNLSYVPADGWTVEPISMPNVRDQHGDVAAEFAINTVFRWYRVDGFADGLGSTLKIPGYEAEDPEDDLYLEDISQVFPLFEKLLEDETSLNSAFKSTKVHPPFRLYGKVINSSPELKWKGPLGNQDISEEIREPSTLDTWRGLVKFEKPMRQYAYEAGPNGALDMFAGSIYLEAAFRIRSNVTRQFLRYRHTLEVDPDGFGYESHNDPGMNIESITHYSAGHEEGITASNQAELDAYALVLHATTAGLYTSVKSLVVHYNKPMQNARCDGLTSQVQHVISDGTGGRFSGHHTVVAQNMNHDTFIRTANERQQSRNMIRRTKEEMVSNMLKSRGEKAFD